MAVNDNHGQCRVTVSPRVARPAAAQVALRADGRPGALPAGGPPSSRLRPPGTVLGAQEICYFYCGYIYCFLLPIPMENSLGPDHECHRGGRWTRTPSTFTTSRRASWASAGLCASLAAGVGSGVSLLQLLNSKPRLYGSGDYISVDRCACTPMM